MPTDIRIAPLEPHDYDGYVKLMEILSEQHFDARPDIFRRGPLPFLTLDQYVKLLLRSDRRLFGAKALEGLVGFVQVRRIEEVGHPAFVPERVANIDEIAVDRGFRRQGVATALLDAAEAWATAEGCRAVTLTVFEFNESAHAAYVRSGYETQLRCLRKDIGPDERRSPLNAAVESPSERN